MAKAAASIVLLIVVAVDVSSARGACAPSTPMERWKRADVIIDARALEGPTASGVQRFRVVRYLKGRGPTAIRAATGVAHRPDGSGVASGEGLLVRSGERWRIFARGSARAVLRTSACDGSWRH
jgi:hypothetical protein